MLAELSNDPSIKRISDITGFSNNSQSLASAAMIEPNTGSIPAIEDRLLVAAIKGDWDLYCTLRDELLLAPHMFHDKIMNAFKLAIEHHSQDIAEDILSVELVELLLKNLMASKLDALADYQLQIVLRGKENEQPPSTYVDRDRAFFLNEPIRICIRAKNWRLCALLLPSYIESISYGESHGAQGIREIENVDIATFRLIPPETCYKMLPLSMPKPLKKVMLRHIDTSVPPDTTIKVLTNAMGRHSIDLEEDLKPGSVRDLLNMMYGMPFGKHRGEDWNAVMQDFRETVAYLDISEFTYHTYWVQRNAAAVEDAEESLLDDDVPTDDDCDDLDLMTDDDSDAETVLPDAQDVQTYRDPGLMVDNNADVTMETAHEYPW
ncbi:hypothetical protein BJX65DRAFT_302054 [Aspergillus insuetus]